MKEGIDAVFKAQASSGSRRLQNVTVKRHLNEDKKKKKPKKPEPSKIGFDFYYRQEN
jgi:hypothetical protein